MTNDLFGLWFSLSVLCAAGLFVLSTVGCLYWLSVKFFSNGVLKIYRLPKRIYLARIDFLSLSSPMSSPMSSKMRVGCFEGVNQDAYNARSTLRDEVLASRFTVRRYEE